MDDSIMDGDSIFNISDDENSDFVPEKPAPVGSTRSVMVMQITDSLAAQKTKAKPAPKKAAAAKPKAAA
jgi:hypothetical protein